MRETLGLCPEEELLLACGNSCLSEAKKKRIKSLLLREVNWAYLLRTAYGHRLIPRLYWQLHSVCPEAASKPPLSDLRDEVDRNGQRNRFLLQKLTDTLHLLQASGISALPFKGPIGMASLGGPQALGMFWNLDLLIHPKDLSMAKQSLLSQGYPMQEGVDLRAECKARFFSPDGRFYICLYWGIVPRRLALDLETEPLWNRLGQISTGDLTVPTLSPEDLLPILCIQGAERGWNELAGLVEVSEIVRFHDRMDWKQILEGARRDRYERILLLGLGLAHQLLETPLPEEILGKISVDSTVKELSRNATRRLFPKGAECPRPWEIRILWIKSRERLGDKLLCGFRLLGRFRLGMRNPSRFSSFGSSPMNVVDRMLELAEVTSEDLVYDLGCGDGRVVVRAAQRFGARGVGVDIDPERIVESRANARQAGVEHLVKFVRQDAMTADVSLANVVVLYVNETLTARLCPRLQAQLQRSARIVSHQFELGDWIPLKVDTVVNADEPHWLYLWRLPP